MADASIIDIGGVQWNVKDKEAREKITVIEDSLTVKDLPNIKITMNPGYSTASFVIYNHYSLGKIHFATVRLENIAGSNIGTSSEARIALLDIKPKKDTSFLLFDFLSARIMRCYLNTSGYFIIAESNSIQSGRNVSYGELIFAEA